MNNRSMIIVIYFIVVAIYGIIEIYLQLRFSKWKFRKYKDKGLVFIMIPFYLTVYFAPIENILVRNKLYLTLIAIGFSILIFGIFLRILSLLKLRENFSMVVESGDKNSLIVGGLYKYIRHPLYLATILIAVSGCLIFTCYFTWIFFILTFISILNRIKTEESFLNSKFQGY
jgi:protein-S-isoprenylcysteine O-methyltransferase Ste14